MQKGHSMSPLWQVVTSQETEWHRLTADTLRLRPPERNKFFAKVAPIKPTTTVCSVQLELIINILNQ